MEDVIKLAKRIEANHDDLEAWQKLGDLVDDPQKKRDCREQVTRLHNASCGVLDPLPCQGCGTNMRVVPAADDRPVSAICPACGQTAAAGRDLPSAEQTRRTGSRHREGAGETAQLKSTLTLTALLAANLLPIFGLLFLGWSMGSVMLLYWFENVIVGLFALLKMALAQGLAVTSRGTSTSTFTLRAAIAPPPAGSLLSKLIILPFFCLHFGLFCLGHGVFVLVLFLPRDLSSAQWLDLLLGLSVPILGMLISHGIHFYQHYLRSEAYKYASLKDLMLEPYARIVPMHVGLIAAGFFIVTLGSPLVVVLLLILLKTGAEAAAYLKSRKRWHRRTA